MVKVASDREAIDILAANVRRLMKDRARPITQQALEAASGVPQPTISRILNAQGGPSVCSLLRIADALGVSLDSLFKEQKSRIPEMAS
jgi:transcriptional regulator with XRE-family HTH domain